MSLKRVSAKHFTTSNRLADGAEILMELVDGPFRSCRVVGISSRSTIKRVRLSLVRVEFSSRMIGNGICSGFSMN